MSLEEKSVGAVKSVGCESISPEVVKKKKGRPRKDATSAQQPTITEAPEVEKKKRGRKKKEVVIEEKKKKKRGRKAQVKYFSSSIRKKIPLTTFFQDQDNAILHLDINDNDEINQERINFESIKSSHPLQTFDEDPTATQDIETVFEKLKMDDSPQMESVRAELVELLDNDKNILSDFLDSQHDSTRLDNTSIDKEIDLRDLYETRINFRETQDKLLVDKLEVLHKDEAFISQLVGKDSTQYTRNFENGRQETQDLNRRKGYFEMLYNFVHNTQWLEHTDVCCWWCCHQFNSIPIGMPNYFNRKSRKFIVQGVFCSFACMTAYRDTKTHNVNTNSLVSYMYSKLTAEPIGTKIQRAPPRETLKMFGGELTIEEFRSSSSETTIYKMVEYPMIVARDYIEEIDIANVKNVNLKVFDESSFTRVVNLDNKRVQDARTRLSSQIEKSTVTIGNTIDKFIKVN